VTGERGDPCAGGDAELDARRPDASRRARDEQPLTRTQAGLREEGVVGGREGLHEPARLRVAESGRGRQRVPLVDGDELRLPAAAEEGDDTVAGREVAHRTPGVDDLADALEPGNVGRRARRSRVPSRALHEVGAVDPGAADEHEQLISCRNGIGTLLDLDPPLRDDRRDHASAIVRNPSFGKRGRC
jgi:hypothetical protein